ncbi:unnamed protein product, partial [Chrysoparadoxa australica]
VEIRRSEGASSRLATWRPLPIKEVPGGRPFGEMWLVLLVAVVELLLLPLALAASCDIMDVTTNPNYPGFNALLILSGTEMDPVGPGTCNFAQTAGASLSAASATGYWHEWRNIVVTSGLRFGASS